MELRHLRYFIRAAELLHFTRAAESLYISQPSLSVHIQQLEEELKTKLFARVGRNVQLTQAGEVLLVRARRAVQELETAGIEIEAITGLLRGTLQLATIPMFGSRTLPAWIDAFSLLHPNVHLRVRATLAEDVEGGLLSGTYDLGFSLSPPEHSELNLFEVVSDQIVMIISTKHPLAKKERLVREDLIGLPMALPSHRISSSRFMGNYFESINIEPNILIEQDDGHALLELAKLSGYVTFLPRTVVREDPELRFVELPAPGIPIAISAMWTQLSPAASAFLDVIKSATSGKAAKGEKSD